MMNTQLIDIGDQHPAADKALITLSTEVGCSRTGSSHTNAYGRDQGNDALGPQPLWISVVRRRDLVPRTRAN